ncbi:hypothetical protein DV515_00000088, partial [Chloebia gouldiae]
PRHAPDSPGHAPDSPRSARARLSLSGRGAPARQALVREAASRAAGASRCRSRARSAKRARSPGAPQRSEVPVVRPKRDPHQLFQTALISASFSHWEPLKVVFFSYTILPKTSSRDVWKLRTQRRPVQPVLCCSTSPRIVCRSKQGAQSPNRQKPPISSPGVNGSDGNNHEFGSKETTELTFHVTPILMCWNCWHEFEPVKESRNPKVHVSEPRWPSHKEQHVPCALVSGSSAEPGQSLASGLMGHGLGHSCCSSVTPAAHRRRKSQQHKLNLIHVYKLQGNELSHGTHNIVEMMKEVVKLLAFYVTIV